MLKISVKKSSIVLILFSKIWRFFIKEADAMKFAGYHD